MEDNSRFLVSSDIDWVAEAYCDDVAFAERAREAALELGEPRIPLLMADLHSQHTPPRRLRDDFPGLADWLVARQFAAFEILYSLGGVSIPALWRVARGEHDWTQGNAIEILSRFAADGVEREPIVSGLRTLLPSLQFDAVVYAAGPLQYYAKSVPRIAAIVDELRAIPVFALACVESASSASTRPYKG